MVNSSLRYEILLYLNSFYFGFFAACEVGMAVLKAINTSSYSKETLQRDFAILVLFLVLETVRVYFGRKGALSDHGWQVITSVFLTIPCALCVYYMFWLQHKTLKLEYILCCLMLALQVVEMFYATLFLFSTCRPTTYT